MVPVVMNAAELNVAGVRERPLIFTAFPRPSTACHPFHCLSLISAAVPGGLTAFYSAFTAFVVIALPSSA